MNNNYFAVIMAGGVGSRFWPVSTSDFPKQFHDMLGTGETLLQKTFNRLSKLIPKENILLLTNEKYESICLEQLPEINKNQILLEPAMRNTAPCILYAGLKIKKQNPEALMIVAPSDHWIENETLFLDHVKSSFEFCAANQQLVTLGIQPTFPNTGYGYIEFDKNDQDIYKKVNQFREKPDYETAKSFVAAGNFLWNAGIFIWSVQTIIDAFEKFQPQMFSLFMTGYEKLNTPSEKAFIQTHYGESENVSIDYAIMEKAENINIMSASFDWNDLGTWGSLYQKLDKDLNQNAVINAQVVLEDASGNMLRTQKGKQVIIKGLSDFIIVDEDNKLIILPRSEEQAIKTLVSKL
jgi:mannose-1-phosphate guanylyltransferase